MNHSFNIDIAKKHGLEEAIIIENIAFWTKKNIANNKNFNEGRYWVYNSVKAFSELFPYISEKKIYRVLKRLEDKSILITGNYNKSSYDRTKWYCLVDKSICQFYKLHLPKKENGKDKTGEPIPYINTDIDTDINTDKNIVAKKFSDNAFKLAEYLLNQIIKNVNPPTYKQKLPNLKNWASDIDKLIRIDKQKYQLIKDTINFATTDHFWQNNILSGAKLRKQFDRLVLASRKTTPKIQKNAYNNLDDMDYTL